MVYIGVNKIPYMAQKSTLLVNSDVLSWVINSSGWDVEDLSKQTNINSKSIQKWKIKDAFISIKNLEKLSRVIKRPISIFLLPTPPNETILIDYRKINAEKLSKNTSNVIRKARYVQSNIKEMLELRSENIQPNITHRTLQDNPEKVATIEKDIHGVEFEKLKEGVDINKHAKQLYQNLKTKIESLNIFVMEGNMETNMSSGFVLVGNYPSVILINSEHKPISQLFTLLHEYAHVLLKKDGICMLNSDVDNYSTSHHLLIEEWCNRFTKSILVSNIEFFETFEQIDTNKEQTLVQQCINLNGMAYIKLVSDSKDRGLITAFDMAEYLNLQVEYFNDLEKIVYNTIC